MCRDEELSEKVARIIHDMKNDTQSLVGVLFDLRGQCNGSCGSPSIPDDFEKRLYKLMGAFPELIDAVFDEKGKMRKPG